MAEKNDKSTTAKKTKAKRKTSKKASSRKSSARKTSARKSGGTEEAKESRKAKKAKKTVDASSGRDEGPVEEPPAQLTRESPRLPRSNLEASLAGFFLQDEESSFDGGLAVRSPRLAAEKEYLSFRLADEVFSSSRAR